MSDAKYMNDAFRMRLTREARVWNWEQKGLSGRVLRTPVIKQQINVFVRQITLITDMK
jgi:hypothetical protein